jgi:hypothetical protein
MRQVLADTSVIAPGLDEGGGQGPDALPSNASLRYRAWLICSEEQIRKVLADYAGYCLYRQRGGAEGRAGAIRLPLRYLRLMAGGYPEHPLYLPRQG